MKFNLTSIVALAAVGIVIVGGYAKVNGYRSQVIAAETRLSADYQNDQNQLSSYVLGFGEQVGIADRQAQQLRTILTDAVKGRYDGKMSSAQVGQGTLFSAISEAYPQIDLKSYDKIVAYIQANREAFRVKQESLLGNIANYEVLVNGDIINSILANILGVPTHNLQARIGKNVVYGEAALAQIKTIVTDSTTSEAFDSGTMKPLTAPALPQSAQ
jgi:hypothetical protein